MDAFYERILSPDHNGAAFFAVCRGKACTYVTTDYNNNIMFSVLIIRIMVLIFLSIGQ